MNTVVQLDFFQPTTDEDILKAEIAALRESHHAVRKKLFAQVGALQKMVLDQQEQIDYLKVQTGLACQISNLKQN